MDWKRLFDALGLNGTRWQWRIIRWQNAWADWKAQAWGKKQAVTYRHKFCPECGAIVERHDRTCPQCGARVQGWHRQSAARAIGLIRPGACAVTPTLLAANTAVMLVMMLRYGPEVLFRQSGEIMTAMGALVPAYWHAGEYWRLITYGYLHYGLWHFGFNLLALSQVGPLLENEIGPRRFFSVYTLALIAGGTADLLVRPDLLAPIAGASGALFGLIGFGAAYCHFSGGSLRSQYRNFFLTWGVYGFVFGLLIRADNIAHGGGFLAGAALGWLVERERLHRDRWTPVWGWVAAVLALATLAAYLWLILAQGPGSGEGAPG